ncbi:hypothetical protein LLH03_18565 [bacterium]|nr:hypothetical protein [bacterium]
MRTLRANLVTGTVCLLLLAVACMASAEKADQTPLIAKQCCRDLAKRLKVPVEGISVAEAKPTVWRDASLGLPRPGEMYAQALTPGWRVIVEAKSGKYLYCTSSRKISYGGPVSTWQGSALYLAEPAQPDGDLNQDLYQISLAGTNPTLLLPYVSSFYPQADGSIIADRRTSRSGFDLLYLAPGQVSKERKLTSAFAFGAAVVSPESKLWYGFIRQGLGAIWTLQATSLTDPKATPQVYELPELARPGRLIVEDGRFYSDLYIGDKHAWYRFDPRNAAAGWEHLGSYWPPDPFSLVLSKSQSLSAEVTRDGDKPVTEIVELWFTGQEDPVAKIGNFEYKGMARMLGRFALLWGGGEGDMKAYTVDLRTGEVIECIPGSAKRVQPFLAAPHGSPLQ